MGTQEVLVVRVAILLVRATVDSSEANRTMTAGAARGAEGVR